MSSAGSPRRTSTHATRGVGEGKQTFAGGEARKTALRASEAQLQAAVIDLARLRGWRVHVVHDSRRSPEGWPDIFACRGDRLVAVELKTATGRVRPQQLEWLQALAAAGVETLLARLPDDWPDVEALLR